MSHFPKWLERPIWQKIIEIQRLVIQRTSSVLTSLNHALKLDASCRVYPLCCGKRVQAAAFRHRGHFSCTMRCSGIHQNIRWRNSQRRVCPVLNQSWVIRESPDGARWALELSSQLEPATGHCHPDFMPRSTEAQNASASFPGTYNEERGRIQTQVYSVGILCVM